MLSEGSVEEIKDSLLEARMWSEQALREALLIALRQENFITSVNRCDYKPGAGWCIKGQLVWSNKTELAVEQSIRRVVRQMALTNFGWQNRMNSAGTSQLDYYAECGVFRD